MFFRITLKQNFKKKQKIIIFLTAICFGLGQIKITVYSADDDAHKQQLSTIGTLLIAISTLVNDTYSPPRNLIKSFFRSKLNFNYRKNKKKTKRTNYFQCSIGKHFSNITRTKISCTINFFKIHIFF
jgi:hypothetical protein